MQESPAEGGQQEAATQSAADSRQAQIARLQAIGYTQGDEPPPSEDLVWFEDLGRVWPGYNLYVSEHSAKVYMLDLEGRVLHVWELPVQGLGGRTLLRRLELLENGELLVLIEARGLFRIDRDGKVLSAYLGASHHDFELLEDGSLYVLTNQAGIFPQYSEEDLLLNDFVRVLGPDGEVRKTISFVDAFLESPYAHLLDDAGEGDVFHSNTVELLDGSLADRDPSFAAGNLLVSCRNIHAIAVIDVETEKVVWALTGLFRAQHDPSVQEDGTILIFDNKDLARGPGASRVIKVDPFEEEVVWEFHSTEDFPFGSGAGGACQALPNGNVLVTEARKGRILEIDPQGEVVWSFVNPARVGDDGESVAVVYQMLRVPVDTPLDWIPERDWPADVLTRP